MKRILLITISLIMIFLSDSLAQEECKTKEKTPIGLTNQGGYSFNYQSGKGQNCRVYRLRNTPGRLQTPVRWKDEQEVFHDCDLLECSVGSVCPWIESILPSYQPIKVGKTTLSYGVNKDEYKDQPDAYQKKPEKITKFPPLTSILRGIVADAEKKPFELAIQVYSSVEGIRPYRLIYVMAIVGKSRDFQILRPGIFPAHPLSPVLIWEAAASNLFFEYLSRRGIRELSAKLGKIVVDISAKDIHLEEAKMLVVIQGNKRIAAITAPAYKPKD